MTMHKTTITIVKTFDAPVESVWKYWSEPEYFKQWWGPAAATCIASRIDFRVGGTYHNCLRIQGREGKTMDAWATGTYKVIEPFKKIVFSDCFADESGNIVSASYYGIADGDDELEVDITFEVLGADRTKMTLRHTKLHKTNEHVRHAMEKSWQESFNKIRRIL
jgi:uncharacterized protein YndB with AHSA1/START domain